ncbi:GIY-YIG nuclease family protein [Thalassospira sp. MCCC 1A01428]|uniref:GIY-YIG nuclease family protein n=1 Tax=Thalassospira sp. MCCC 1A01428 TaxID=1470575 RepID=UPI001AEFE967|nr:GIY-YIG nuclease family protein [Thalassospira sp. MCCC 1A01428]
MAEQTRKGHVYIISNIGSFGENVYKIGLTRRLDPMDRVKELGDASVPFPFDVHAIIYYDDAPALEAALHREFSHSRVNAVNLRKEFFRVDLDKIRAATNKLTEREAEFRTTIVAEEYYETKRLQEAHSA